MHWCKAEDGTVLIVGGLLILQLQMWLERVVLWACLQWMKEALCPVNLSLKVFELSPMYCFVVPAASTVLL